MRSMHKIWGLSISEIARRRGLPRETVRDIIRRRTWTHV
jgi:DNA-directed RNA polymerase specialized sigma24 family protein